MLRHSLSTAMFVRTVLVALLAGAAGAQDLFRPAPPCVPGPFRRVLMGRFTSTQSQDVAVLAGEQLWAVSRPVTWGAYYAAGVSGVADIARLPRTTGAPNDHILCVG